jgi:cytochrome c-type biogenesis protein CcmH
MRSPPAMPNSAAFVTAACLTAALASAATAPAPGALGAAQAPVAVDVYGELENPALEVRYERITHDLRCLVCQNESIADSNVELAADLRRQVREMLIGADRRQER